MARYTAISTALVYLRCGNMVWFGRVTLGISALEALCNAPWKFSTYLLTYSGALKGAFTSIVSSHLYRSGLEFSDLQSSSVRFRWDERRQHDLMPWFHVQLLHAAIIARFLTCCRVLQYLRTKPRIKIHSQGIDAVPRGVARCLASCMRVLA